KQEGLLARVLTRLTAKPSKFIATMLVGNNIVLVIYGFYMGELIVSKLYPGYLDAGELPLRIIFVQTLISTMVILVTGEFLPKVFFQVYANKLLRVLAFPAYGFYMLFSFVSE